MIPLFHSTMATADRRPLFGDIPSVRRAVRSLVEIAQDELVLFTFVDDHAHNVLAATRSQVGRINQALNLVLRRLSGGPIAPAFVRPVEGRRHMERLVTYLLQQGPHHGLPHDPALWDGSCFTDLAGARHLPGLTLQIRRALPRFQIDHALRAVDLGRDALRPASDRHILGEGLFRLVERATAAAAVPSDLAGGSKATEIVATKRAIANLGLTAGFRPNDLASALHVTPRTIRRLAQPTTTPDIAALQQAIRIRYTLEEACLDRRRRQTR